MAEAACGIWWYRIAFAPEVGEPWVTPEGVEVVTVYVTNAVRTSAGPGPGPKILPFEEAAALVADQHAVCGTEPPEGYLGGGGTGLRR